MTFLNPALAFAGFACVAIPILIHILMRRRRRPIPWGAMRFLLEAYRRQRRRMNLEQILLLAARCLLVLLLAAALGKPFFGSGAGESRAARRVYVLLDNALTSALDLGQGSALDASREQAIAFLRTLDAGRGDTAALITLAGPADRVVIPPSSDLGGVIESVRQAPACDSRADLAGALAILRDDLASPDRAAGAMNVIAIASELRAGCADVESSIAALPPGVGDVRVLILGAGQNEASNTAIAGVDPLRSVVLAGEEASASTPVRVTLRRHGPIVSEAQASRVTIEARSPSASDTTTLASASAVHRWTPGQDTGTITLALDLRPPKGATSAIALHARIEPDALPRDDAWICPLTTRRRLEIALLEQRGTGTDLASFRPGDWWALALAPRDTGPLAKPANAELALHRIDPGVLVGPGGEAALRGMDAIIISAPDALDPGAWRLIAKAGAGGALLIVNPPADGATHAWSTPMREALGLDWPLPLEAVAIPENVTITRPASGSREDLLSLLAPELDELLRPVSVSRLLPPEGDPSRFEPVLTLSDGRPLVVASGLGEAGVSRGVLLYLAASIDPRWTDLPTKPLMVPLAQELVRQGIGRAQGLRVVTAGLTPQLPVGARELSLLGADARIIALSTPTGIRRAGLYAVRDSSGATLSLLGVNPDPAASNTRLHTPDRLERWLSPLGRVEIRSTEGAATNTTPPSPSTSPWSVVLLGAALGLACLELIAARYFSHAHADDLRQEAAP